MKVGQTLRAPNGAEIALFPMEALNVTQGRYSKFSHVGYNATDLGGKDSGIDNVIAPFTLLVVWKDPVQNTGVAVTNVYSVRLANGRTLEPKSILMLLWHDNYVGDLWVGKVIPQGQVFYQEGTAGWATGNHVHLELSYLKWDGGYPLYQLSNGYWTTRGQELNIEDAFYINDTRVINSGGYNFTIYKPAKSVQELAKEVIQGIWGTGEQRKVLLTREGYNYELVQAEVNAMLAPPPIEYIVKPGDTLGGIAKAHGTTWQYLARHNKLENPDKIFPGQKILI